MTCSRMEKVVEDKAPEDKASEDISPSAPECTCHGETGFVFQAYWDTHKYGDDELEGHGCISKPYTGVRKMTCSRMDKELPAPDNEELLVSEDEEPSAPECTCHGETGYVFQSYWDTHKYGDLEGHGCILTPYTGVRKLTCSRISEGAEPEDDG